MLYYNGESYGVTYLNSMPYDIVIRSPLTIEEAIASLSHGGTLGTPDHPQDYFMRVLRRAAVHPVKLWNDWSDPDDADIPDENVWRVFTPRDHYDNQVDIHISEDSPDDSLVITKTGATVGIHTLEQLPKYHQYYIIGEAFDKKRGRNIPVYLDRDDDVDMGYNSRYRAICLLPAHLKTQELLTYLADAYGIMPGAMDIEGFTPERALAISEDLDQLWYHDRSANSSLQPPKELPAVYASLSPMEREIMLSAGFEDFTFLCDVQNPGRYLTQDFIRYYHKVYSHGRSPGSPYWVNERDMLTAYDYPVLRKIMQEQNEYAQSEMGYAIRSISIILHTASQLPSTTTKTINEAEVWSRLNDFMAGFRDKQVEIACRSVAHAIDCCCPGSHRESDDPYRFAWAGMPLSLTINGVREPAPTDAFTREMAMTCLNRCLSAEMQQAILGGMRLYATHPERRDPNRNHYDPSLLANPGRLYTQALSGDCETPPSRNLQEVKALGDEYRGTFGRVPKVLREIATCCNPQQGFPIHAANFTVGSMSRAAKTRNPEMIHLAALGFDFSRLPDRAITAMSHAVTESNRTALLTLRELFYAHAGSMSDENILQLVTNLPAHPMMAWLDHSGEKDISVLSLSEIEEYTGKSGNDLVTDLLSWIPTVQSEQAGMHDMLAMEEDYRYRFQDNTIKIAGWDTGCRLGNYSAYILPPGDVRHFTAGKQTNCCMHYEGAAESCVYEATSNPYAGIWILENDKHRMLASAFVWTDEQSKTFVFDNIEFANDRCVNDYVDILHAYCRQLPYPNIHMGLGYNQMSNIGSRLATDSYARYPVAQRYPYSDYNKAVSLKKDGNMQFLSIGRTRLPQNVELFQIAQKEKEFERLFPDISTMTIADRVRFMAAVQCGLSAELDRQADEGKTDAALLGKQGRVLPETVLQWPEIIRHANIITKSRTQEGEEIDPRVAALAIRFSQNRSHSMMIINELSRLYDAMGKDPALCFDRFRRAVRQHPEDYHPGVNAAASRATAFLSCLSKELMMDIAARVDKEPALGKARQEWAAILRENMADTHVDRIPMTNEESLLADRLATAGVQNHAGLHVLAMACKDLRLTSISDQALPHAAAAARTGSSVLIAAAAAGFKLDNLSLQEKATIATFADKNREDILHGLLSTNPSRALDKLTRFAEKVIAMRPAQMQEANERPTFHYMVNGRIREASPKVQEFFSGLVHEGIAPSARYISRGAPVCMDQITSPGETIRHAVLTWPELMQTQKLMQPRAMEWIGKEGIALAMRFTENTQQASDLIERLCRLAESLADRPNLWAQRYQTVTTARPDLYPPTDDPNQARREAFLSILNKPLLEAVRKDACLRSARLSGIDHSTPDKMAIQNMKSSQTWEYPRTTLCDSLAAQYTAQGKPVPEGICVLADTCEKIGITSLPDACLDNAAKASGTGSIALTCLAIAGIDLRSISEQDLPALGMQAEDCTIEFPIPDSDVLRGNVSFEDTRAVIEARAYMAGLHQTDSSSKVQGQNQTHPDFP